jgi:hypothetical protein
MSAEEVAKQIEAVDRQLNTPKPKVSDEERNIDISGLYARYSWSVGGKPSPLPADALTTLKLEDKAGDPRWAKHFLGNAVHLGLYRSRIGFYWLLRYDAAVSGHWLENVGAAADVEQRFAKKT